MCRKKGCVILLSTGKSLRKDYMRYVSATAASLLIFSCYSMIDGLMVARGVSEYAMSAVNLAIPFINMLFAIAVLFGVGTSTVVAIMMAEKKGREINRLFSQNSVVLAVMGLVITAIVQLFTEPIALMLGANELTIDYVVTYLRGVSPFAMCFLISYNYEVLVKTDGFPRYALFAVTSGCALHFVLDYVFIFLMDMGVVGAAIATGSSQLLTCILYLAHFLGKKASFRFERFKFDFKIYKRILPIGVSDGILEFCTGAMIFVFNHVVLDKFGNDGVVTYTIIAYINTIVINLMMSVPQGSQPLVSYNFGAKGYKTLKKLLTYGFVTVSAMAIFVFAIVFFFAEPIVGAFLKDSTAELMLFSVDALKEYGVSYIIVGFNILISGFLTAIERPVPAISISLSRGFVVQAACLLLIANVISADMLWFAPAISEVLCLLAAAIMLKLNWKKYVAPLALYNAQ